MYRYQIILRRLPATSVEIAHELNITSQAANSHLQALKKMGMVRNTGVRDEKQRQRLGPAPFIWE